MLSGGALKMGRIHVSSTRGTERITATSEASGRAWVLGAYGVMVAITTHSKKNCAKTCRFFLKRRSPAPAGCDRRRKRRGLPAGARGLGLRDAHHPRNRRQDFLELGHRDGKDAVVERGLQLGEVETRSQAQPKTVVAL
jgi:hypothetical protein